MAKTMKLKAMNLKAMKLKLAKLAPPPDDERGIYGVFFIVFIIFLIAAVGIAIDGPRNLTTDQRTRDVAEEAARYAVGLISNGEDNFNEVRQKTAVFVAIQDSGGSNSRQLVMTGLSCNARTGEVIANVRGSLRNTFSGIIFGPNRTFDSSASAGIVFVTPGGEEQTVNICDPDLTMPVNPTLP